MKPFDITTKDVLLHRAVTWSSLQCPEGENLLDALSKAWLKKFQEVLTLPEPWDLGEGNMVYVVTPSRLVHVHEPKADGTPVVDILEPLPLYYLRENSKLGPTGLPRFIEYYTSDELAVFNIGTKARSEDLSLWSVYRRYPNSKDHDLIFTYEEFDERK